VREIRVEGKRSEVKHVPKPADMVVDASKFLCMSLNFYSLNRGLVHGHWLYLKMIIQLREAGRGVTRRINFRVINFLLARASYAVTYLTNLQ
jgi:hypothetical protein